MMQESTEEEERLPAKEFISLADKDDKEDDKEDDKVDVEADTSVATLIPKTDGVVVNKQTTVYSHGDMTRRLSVSEENNQDKEGKQKASPLAKFFHYKNRADEMLSRRGCYMSNILSLFIPLLMVIFGVVFVSNCEIQPMIPIYLIVGGIFSALEVLYRIGRNLLEHFEVCLSISEKKGRCTSVVRILNGCFLIVWFIAGSAWVYGIFYPDHQDCHLTLYNFSFGLITFVYVASLLALLCGAALVIYANKFVLK